MISDSKLLRQYAAQGDEAAFAEVVRRHTDLVYSAALRIVRDAALAQDVTQAVFTKLAKAAGALGAYPTPIGWLHTTVRHTAIDAVRTEARRRAREHEAFTMQNISAAPDAHWEQLRPILDEAVGRLGERDRQAVLLRFFNGLSHQEVGVVLGLTENSAQKCVDRALEKLRAQFARRGVTVSSALLGAAMCANSVQAAPAGLAADAAKTSTLGAGSGLSLGSAFLLAFYMSTKTKTTAAVIVTIAILGGGFWWLNRSMVTTSEKVVQTTLPSQATTPKATIIATQVEPPKLPAVTPKSDAISGADLSSNTDPQADLKTAIPDFVRLERDGDFVGVYQKYTPPGLVDPERVRTAQMVLQRIAKDRAANPKSDELIREQHDTTMRAYEDLESQVPTYNAAGDEATYMFSPALAGIQTPAGSQPYPMTFIKIDGRWYLKPSEQGNNLIFLGGPGGGLNGAH